MAWWKPAPLKVDLHELGNGRIYVSYHSLLSLLGAGVAVILAGIFTISTYIITQHERQPHVGTASFVDLKRMEIQRKQDLDRLELHLNRIDQRIESLQQVFQRLPALMPPPSP